MALVRPDQCVVVVERVTHFRVTSDYFLQHSTAEAFLPAFATPAMRSFTFAHPLGSRLICAADGLWRKTRLRNLLRLLNFSEEDDMNFPTKREIKQEMRFGLHSDFAERSAPKRDCQS